VNGATQFGALSFVTRTERARDVFFSFYPLCLPETHAGGRVGAYRSTRAQRRFGFFIILSPLGSTNGVFLALRATHSRSPLLREDERARLPHGYTPRGEYITPGDATVCSVWSLYQNYGSLRVRHPSSPLTVMAYMIKSNTPNHCSRVLPDA
jgi:hypothetical protein